MYYEVWGLHPANLVATVATEREAVALVRDLLQVGWSLDDVSVSQEADDELESSDGLQAWEGAELQQLLQAVA